MGDILGEAIVFVILNVIGGTIRWLIASGWRFIFNTPKLTYKEYLFDHDNDELNYDSIYTYVNIALGIGFIVLVVLGISKI